MKRALLLLTLSILVFDAHAQRRGGQPPTQQDQGPFKDVKWRQIGRVAIHPRDPNIVFVAALGHQFGPNPERGVYRTTDGGTTWKQVLTRGPKAGAVDLSIDPNNPNVIFAAFWEVYRTPFDLE